MFVAGLYGSLQTEVWNLSKTSNRSWSYRGILVLCFAWM